MTQSERGAVIVQAAVAMTMLLAFGTFVVDYGMLWVSRGQAQTAADAGALAGAIGLAYDAGTDPTVAATAVASNGNLVWTQPPAPVATTVTCPPDASRGPCLRVDVYRNGANGSSALPVLFGPIIGVTSQGVKATAMAQVKVGNATNCLKPWAIPDKWTVHRPADGPWTPTSQFQHYVDGQPLGSPSSLLPPPIDVYTPPSASDPGTGLQTSDDPSTTLVFPPDSQIFPGRILPLDLSGVGTYAQNVASCVGNVISVGQQMPISAAVPALSDFADLAAQDASATWSSGQITGSCAPGCAPVSPRLVPLVLYDVDRYASRLAANDWSGCDGGKPCIWVANIAGFFINDVTGPGVGGFLTNYSGLVTVQDQLEVQSSFLKAITLIR